MKHIRNIAVSTCTLLTFSSPFRADAQVSANELRTAIPNFSGVQDIDPHVITNAYQSVVASSLYSSLVDFDLDTGDLVGAIAKKFNWDGNELVLEIRSDFHTSTGELIDSEDVYLSLKRLILVSKSAGIPVRSRLDNLLCPGEIKSLKDECQNVKLVDKKTIRLKFPSSKPEFVEALAGKPLRILPKKSFDHITMKIVDFKSTTGPYYLSNSKDRVDSLSANDTHWQFRKDMPQKIHILPESKEKDSPNSIRKLFLDNKIDFISKLSALKPEEYEELQKTVKGSEIFRTNELGLTMFIFTNKGLALPVEIRRDISKAILQVVRQRKEKLATYRSANNQFMIPGGFGSLSQDQLAKIERAMDEAVDLRKIPKIRIGISANIRDTYRTKLFSSFDSIFEYVDVKSYAEVENKRADDPNVPHIYFSSNDIEFYESFFFVSYLLDRGIFNIRGDASKPWLDAYMAEADKAKREALLRKLHFESVFENPSVIPLFTKPFISLARNGWRPDFSRNSTQMPFTRILKK